VWSYTQIPSHRGLARDLAAALLALGLVAGCAGSSSPEPPPKTAEDLFGEANETLNGFSVLYLLKSVDYTRAIAQFQEIIDNYPFSEFATLSELKIADAYFDQADFVQASSFYQEFVELHPTHPRVPYALLRNGECAFAQMLEVDQDQAKTRESIQLFDALTDRFPRSEEAQRAVELRVQARERLALHEVVVGNFYFETEKYHAAVPRYEDALALGPRHDGFRETQVRLGIALRKSGQVDRGTAVLQAILPDPELDSDVREVAEEELGFEVAIRSDESEGARRGWRFWPFGRGDEPAVEEAAVEEPATLAASQVEVASEPTSAESEGEAANAGEPEEDSGRRWYWPF